MSFAVSTTPSTRTAWVAAPMRARATVLFIILAAALAGALATGADTSARAVAESGADLTRLLRAMAAIKVLMAAAAAGAVVWRLAAPVSPAWLAGYALAGAAMAAGPGLIWGMAHVAAGAALLHAGLIATVVLLWRDPATGQRLAHLVAARRARRGG
jgi:hypothetical protein